MNSQTNNKSRTEELFVFVDDDYQCNPNTKKRPHDNNRRKFSKSKKKSPAKLSPTSTSKKYFPGEFIYDTKGQMAEIKYIGQCHKGAGTWFGIEFIDGSLGKHNGTINGHTYFRGSHRRCDMIRSHKIRSKASPNKLNKSNKSYTNMHRIRRANSDLLQMESISLADLSDNYFKKNQFNAINVVNKLKPKSKKKHKRNASQPTSLMMQKKDRSYSVFGHKSREEKAYKRKYKQKQKQIKTVKKEKYKGNKYILAMEEQCEKRKNERIGFIKTERKRVKKQKHERNSSKVQEILKQKQLEKEYLNKLNAENKLKELQRIQLAKQKSKKKLKIKQNRIRSNSDQNTNTKKYKTKNIPFNTPNNRNNNSVNFPPISIIDDNDTSLTISHSTTPLANDFEFKLSPIPSNNLFDNDNDTLDDDDESFDEDEINETLDTVSTPELLRSYSDSDVSNKYDTMVLPKKSHKMDAMFPVNSDSALLLQELSTIDSDDDDECPSPVPLNIETMPMNSINSITPKKPKKQMVKMRDMALLKENDDVKEIEDSSFYFPMYNNNKQRSNSCEIGMLNRTKSTPLFNTFDEKGTDYWIKKYNKMNEKLNNTQNEIEKQIGLMKHNNDLIISQPKPIQMSKSVEINNHVKDDDKKEDNRIFYGAMSNTKSIKQRSHSLASPSLLKRTDSAPIICNDDKGTDYWIKQYNKANKNKKKSKKSKRKSKSKRKKTSRSKTVTKKNKHIINTNNNEKKSKNKNKIKPQPLCLPKTIPLLSNHSSFNSIKSPYFQSEIDDNISDILTTTSTLSTLSNITIDNNSIISSVASSISSLMSSPATSTDTSNNNSTNNTPNDTTNIIDMNKNLHQMIANISYQSKYGVYPFKRKHENYINKKFTGIVRIGHRYLLRDGRIGVVRYINQTRFAPGTWYGIELDKKEGEHNGIVNNIKYFTCQHNYGTFIKKSQIAQYIARDNKKSLSKNQLKRLNNVGLEL